MAKSNKEFKLNIGTASLLLVFIVLCLVTFEYEYIEKI